MTDEPEEPEDVAVEIETEEESRHAINDTPEIEETANDRKRTRRPSDKDSLAAKYRKVTCSAEAEARFFRSENVWNINIEDLQSALDLEMERARGVAMADPERVFGSRVAYERVRVPNSALESETTYRDFLSSLSTDIVPAWRWLVNTAVSSVGPDGDDLSVSFEFTNGTGSQLPVDGPREHANLEPYLFDAEADFQFGPDDVGPFVLELAPKGFRYDRDLWGRGFNSAVVRDPMNSGHFVASHSPTYKQLRLQTRATPSARFDRLAQDPIPVLHAIEQAMEESLREWDEALAAYREADLGWELTAGAAFESDRARFLDELRRFRAGVELIGTNSDVRMAFELTNETFRRLGSDTRPQKRKEAWRLFQLVFFVSQIPGIAALVLPDPAAIAEREMVDIIYFPTGGGKTEAYLSVIVFHAFFDRLRGKRAGVTAWTRFPLRLLTIQQTQRMADVVGLAEIVRREQTDARLRDGSPFSVGYFVGRRGSPNELVDPQKYRFASPDQQSEWSIASDPVERQRWRGVLSCPSCRTKTVAVELDADLDRLIHRCSNSACGFPDGELPIYVVDNELFRYLPTVLIGTIDKLASIGSQRKVAQLFGAVDGICVKHGYYKTVCPQRGCDQRNLRPGNVSGISGPTLLVQDELHLLKEGLGTFDGHYETFMDELRHELRPGDEAPLKIIASSATIEAFERQVGHLYGRSPRLARIFPGPGPTAGSSFYAQTLDFPQRLFLGVIPHNKTILNSVLELVEYYHRELQELRNLTAGSASPFEGTIQPGSPDWAELIDLYATSLTYFLANRELDSVKTDIEGDVNPNLQRDHFEPIELYTLTGATDTDEVSQVLDRLESGAPGRSAVSDGVLATSMVSHGVDVDRLNGMIFFGMPRQTAEYIQASSRVGRSHVGMVINCLHPARERDRSHFTYFAKYHEFLGQLVEPVAINRWARFSIDRTLPGLFMAVLLQLASNSQGVTQPNRYYMLDYVRGLVSSGALTPKQFVSVLERAYRVAVPNGPAEQLFHDEIERHVRRFLYDQIGGSSVNARFVSEVLYPKPMTSLRDVDIAVPIELDGDGERWAGRGSRS